MLVMVFPSQKNKIIDLLYHISPAMAERGLVGYVIIFLGGEFLLNTLAQF